MQYASTPLSIRVILTGNVHLASPPELFLRLNEVLENPEANLHDAGALIESDPGLSARLLRIVNSAFYGIPSKVTSIHHAVNIIGVQEIRDLVLTTLVVDKFSSFTNSLMTMREFWSMSVRCALTAKLLASFYPNGERLQAVFLCGLLHEIGRLIVYHRLPELARAAALLARSENINYHEGERRIIGFDHYQVGAELARLWRLPEIIAVTIEHHDTPENATVFSRETALVAQSQSFVYSHYFNCGISDDAPATDIAKWNLIGIDVTELNELIPQVNEQFNEVFKLIYPG
ncbi:HDOD domain-containing protein [Methylocaldum sp.]|uniref:HDOD domain-containing protein n=1 Tax=Methylocaldum sp. TaxID=1969727 RepID=UPI002D4CB077|nr:HDOD domain-containing protein [Methylocaldum sp.]HYE36551.1 HDOD domain-containing protein [Methylocaldum sp.]